MKKQYQCNAVGHIYFGESDFDPGCPICKQATSSLRSTQPFYEEQATTTGRPTEAVYDSHDSGLDSGAASTKTIGVYDAIDSGVERVVGWLACVSGPDIGLDWRLIEGRNSIGRDAAMQVALKSDTSVSRQKHAFISFEPKRQVFTLLPGDSRGLVYLNNEEVVLPTKLKPYDRIELGKSILVFVPLACEHFIWEVNSNA